MNGSNNIDIIIPCFIGQERKLSKTVSNIIKNTSNFNLIVIVGERSAAENFNIGLNRIQSKYYCKCDNDIFVSSGWLEHLIMVMNRYPDVGIVSAKIVGINGIEYNNYYRNCPDNMITEVNTIDTGCCLIRNIGLIADKNYKGGWYDDTDFSLSMKQKGYRLLVDGYIKTRHTVSMTNVLPNLEQNKKYFYNKWPDMTEDKVTKIIKSWKLEENQNGKS